MKGLRIHIVDCVLVMCVCGKPSAVCGGGMRLWSRLAIHVGLGVPVEYLVARFGSVRGMLSQPPQICIHALV